MRIINGHLITCEGYEIENGFIEFENGIITKIGDMQSIDHVSDTCYDAEKGFITPGFIDPHCHVGVGVGMEYMITAEYSEITDPIVPHYRAIDSYYPYDISVSKALKYGTTTVITGPGSTTLIGGQLAAIKLSGKFANEASIRSNCAMKFALGFAPLNAFGSRNKSPVTRMGAMSMLREILCLSRQYLNKKIKGANYDFNIKYEALIPLLKREIPAHIHCNRADDILSAIQLTKEFDIRCVLIHAAQALSVIEEIKASNVSLIFGPMYSPSRALETKGLGFENPGLAASVGITTAICTDACPHLSSSQLLLPSAALAVRKGMMLEDAFKAITINAAKSSDIEDRVGSLAVGKDADIVVFNKHPFDFMSGPKAVFIDGRRKF